jgi:hypothetical protein
VEEEYNVLREPCHATQMRSQLECERCLSASVNVDDLVGRACLHGQQERLGAIAFESADNSTHRRAATGADVGVVCYWLEVEGLEPAHELLYSIRRRRGGA